MDRLKIIQDRLLELRGEKSQNDVVCEINSLHDNHEDDISREALRNWENGTRKIKVENLVELADYYDTTVDWILGREGAARNRNPDIQKAMDFTGLSERAIDYFHKLKITAPWNDEALMLISDLFSNNHMKYFIPLLVRYVGLLSQLTDTMFSTSAEFTAMKDELEFYGYVISMPDEQANALFSERIINLLRNILNDIAEERQERLREFVKKTGSALLKTEEKENGVDPEN